jgi:hypothetical protein
MTDSMSSWVLFAFGIAQSYHSFNLVKHGFRNILTLAPFALRLVASTYHLKPSVRRCCKEWCIVDRSAVADEDEHPLWFPQGDLRS